MAQVNSEILAQVEARPFVNFPPSVWRNYFDSFSVNEMEKETYVRTVDALKGKLKEMLVASKSIPLESIKLIDLLSHLGVSYHFEKEIEEKLEELFSGYMLIVNKFNDDLDTIALLFRVFRQNGYYVSSDVFSKFQDNNGKFKEELTRDLRGLLSLYQAAHLRVHGEDILEEALEFTINHFKQLTAQSSHLLAQNHIEHCLDYPIWKNIPRVEARHFISIYEQEESHNNILLEFAKADFNLVQMLHRQELSHITSWRKELATNLTYARDRAVELHFWMTAIYFEPHFSRARIILTKFIIMSSYLDDTFDAYATPEEAEKLANAVERWNMNAMNELPDYMKILYKVMLNLFNELDEEMSKEGRSHVVNNAKKHLKELIYAYNKEAKWCKDNYVPKLEEYMENAMITAATIPLVAASFIGMGEIAGKESIEWLNTYPKIAKAVNIIGRVMDDIKSHKFEQERGHVASAVECYMEEYGVSEEEAVKALNKIVDDAWKDINEECMRPTAISMDILLRVLNFGRSCAIIYKHIDGYTNPEALKDIITSLFVDKIPI